MKGASGVSPPLQVRREGAHYQPIRSSLHRHEGGTSTFFDCPDLLPSVFAPSFSCSTHACVLYHLLSALIYSPNTIFALMCLLQHLCRGFPPPLKLLSLFLVSPKGSHYLRSLKVDIDMQTFARRHILFLYGGGGVCRDGPCLPSLGSVISMEIGQERPERPLQVCVLGAVEALRST